VRRPPSLAAFRGTRRLCAPLFIAGLLMAAGPAFCIDWPVEKKIITGTFGEDRGDHFHGGIDIGGGDQEVKAALAGEVVFRYEEGSDYTSLPRGVGTFVALHNAQDILTLYCHLAEGTLGPARTRYAQQERIGTMGATGHSDGRHLHFAVCDEENGSSVNPLAFLPPLADNQPPVIRRVLLQIGNRQLPLALGANAVTVPPGRAVVLAEVFDLREDVKFAWELAPYSISLGLDGKQISKLAFDSLQVREGRTVVGGTSVSRSDLYADDGLVRCGVADLRTGSSRLRLTARDFAGNETVRDIILTVQD
jgi:hypothetical protein